MLSKSRVDTIKTILDECGANDNFHTRFIAQEIANKLQEQWAEEFEAILCNYYDGLDIEIPNEEGIGLEDIFDQYFGLDMSAIAPSIKVRIKVRKGKITIEKVEE